MEKTTTHSRTFNGTVISTGMNKTVVVRVDRMKLNAKYQKRYCVTKKYHVHDEKGEVKVGDTVIFVECRPLSKTKRWRLVSKQK